MELIIGFMMLGFLFALYFMPAFIASSRDHQNFAPIAIINLFFGWTLVGWVCCLAWASSKVSKEHLDDLRRERGDRYIAVEEFQGAINKQREQSVSPLLCRECGSEANTKAKACPKCGAKAFKGKSYFRMLLIVFLGIAIVLAVYVARQALLSSNPHNDSKALQPHSVKFGVPKKYHLSSGDMPYIVKQGDTIEKIARRFHTTATEILVANSFAGNDIHVGDPLIIPTHALNN